jgi:UDP-N-acetylmuramyl pentapeptide phosphotransferase/UDP-N-acetylglucosamine-1-phosphate transferase
VSAGVLRRLAAAALAAATTSVVRGALDASPPGGAQRWTRTNHAGEPVSLLAGPAVAAGLLSGALVAPSPRAAAALVAGVGAGASLGVVDDLYEDRDSRDKGLRGHLGALAHGRLTTGGLKVLGIGAGGLLAAALAPQRADEAPRGAWARAGDVMLGGALIAATANVVNLLDLRPGRALKAVGLAAAPAVLATGAASEGAPAAAGVLGAVAGTAEADLAGLDMLGDGGANALGAGLGVAIVLGAPRPVRVAWLAAMVAATVASERVSFSAVIERTPVLRDLDAWGRHGDRPGAVPEPA